MAFWLLRSSLMTQTCHLGPGQLALGRGTRAPPTQGVPSSVGPGLVDSWRIGRIVTMDGATATLEACDPQGDPLDACRF